MPPVVGWGMIVGMDRLSPIERRTLIALAESGPGGNFDHIALSKLFTLELVDVSHDRRLLLTEAGKALYGQVISEPVNTPAQ